MNRTTRDTFAPERNPPQTDHSMDGRVQILGIAPENLLQTSPKKLHTQCDMACLAIFSGWWTWQAPQGGIFLSPGYSAPRSAPVFGLPKPEAWTPNECRTNDFFGCFCCQDTCGYSFCDQLVWSETFHAGLLWSLDIFWGDLDWTFFAFLAFILVS